ncbi:hypothetical protein BCR44DRAFT_1426835 [Catenaria anguillulae PL171]|uniref:Uncharacterized protein n=1 Tax=Catenaria anguillulae PL171 TaxID=765915 RepID=A0A1Y2I2F6_9FUNG|nr:hypothetical protein BCR44DRAFT_1426835 [Catenaria anguillulae PL171]
MIPNSTVNSCRIPMIGQQVGRAIQDLIQEGVVTRDQLFVTSKIAPKDHGEERAYEAVKESLPSSVWKKCLAFPLLKSKRSD